VAYGLKPSLAAGVHPCRTVRNCSLRATKVGHREGSSAELETGTVLPVEASDLNRRFAMRLSRQIMFAATVGAVLVVSSFALAAGGVFGTYTATIKNSNHLNGKWVIALTKGGTYTVAQNGNTLARGKYTATATTISFAREPASGCAGTGTYSWKRSGKTITFVRKREHVSCQARAEILGRRFTQVR
jgi:hypothetical protein